MIESRVWYGASWMLLRHEHLPKSCVIALHLLDLLYEEVVGAPRPVWIGFQIELIVVTMFPAETGLDFVVEDGVKGSGVLQCEDIPEGTQLPVAYHRGRARDVSTRPQRAFLLFVRLHECFALLVVCSRHDRVRSFVAEP